MPLEPAETRPIVDTIFQSRELLFQGTINKAKQLLKRFYGWHRIFGQNRSSTTRSRGNHTIKHFRGTTTTIQRLSTATQTSTHNDYNLLTFNTSEISSIVHHLRALWEDPRTIFLKFYWKKFPENVGIVAHMFAKLIIICQSRDPKMAFHIAIFCNRMK